MTHFNVWNRIMITNDRMRLLVIMNEFDEVDRDILIINTIINVLARWLMILINRRISHVSERNLNNPKTNTTITMMYVCMFFFLNSLNSVCMCVWIITMGFLLVCIFPFFSSKNRSPTEYHCWNPAVSIIY